MSEPFILESTPLLPSEIEAILTNGGSALDEYLGQDIYFNSDPSYLAAQKSRMIETVRLHKARVGDRPTYLLRAPGRLNAFLEYLDMCSGDHMSTTIDGDIPVAVSPREDDLVNCGNSNPMFASAEFSIDDEIAGFQSAPWSGEAVGDLPDTWDNRTRVYPYYGRPQGEWLNYVRSSFLRIKWELSDTALHGADMTFGPSNAPFRAGTSSSSAIVVLSFLALYLSNKDRLPSWSMPEICRLLGEAEWYVGTHGGANDQTTILRSLPNGVLYNRHSLPVLDSDSLPCLRGVRVVLADSLWEANKSLGANHTFNLRKGWMDLGDDLMKLIIRVVDGYVTSIGHAAANKQGWLVDLISAYFGTTPDLYPRNLEAQIDLWKIIKAKYNKFGSLTDDLLCIPNSVIEELINLLPADISVDDAGRLLGKDTVTMQRDYTLPYDYEGGYKVRSAATFFYRENRIGRRLESIFKEADSRLKSDEITDDSLEYDRYRKEVGELLELLQDTIRDDFQVSNSQLDLLLQIAKDGPGYLGGKLTGAGSGGCVSILVKEGSEDEFCRYLDSAYYGKPEHFTEYRKVLDALENDPSARDTAVEMKNNLDSALADVSGHRRAVTFSRGACIVDVDRFAAG
ncbi:MAG: hypothetical protein ACYC27_03790 [Armatimonadota bacterium]